MNKDEIKKILDKAEIYVLDEINILEYIDELENKIDKAIEYIENETTYSAWDEMDKLLDILRGKNE